MVFDVDKKNLLNALGISETDHGQLIERILSTAPDCIKLVGKDGTLLTMNQAGLDIVQAGHSEEVIGQCVFDLIADEDLEKFKNTVERAFDGESSVETYQVIGLKGERRRVEQRATPLSDNEGRVVAMLAVTTDATNRIQREEELRQLQIAIENAMGSVSRLDPEGHFMMVRPEYARLLGYLPHELIGESWRVTVPDTELKLGEAMYREMLEHGRAETETLGLRKDGSEFHKQILLMRIDDDEGNFIGHYCLTNDISERKENELKRELLERELAQGRRLDSIGRMAGGIAHDFNNMLEVILGYVDLAKSHSEDNAEVLEYLEEIRSAATNSAELTAHLLSFSRQQPTQPMVVDVNEALEKMLKMLRRLIGEYIELKWLPAGGIPKVMIDVTQLNQVLANLCLNARDAMYGGGTVTISTDRVTVEAKNDLSPLAPGSYALISVADDGAGMSMEIQEQIFEPFFTTKGGSEGTGLGLATVYGIVKQCEGHIEVDSTEGEGSTFRIYLPANEIAATEPKDAAQPVVAGLPEGGTETILLVEDEIAILELLEKLLTSLGYTVHATTSPTEALSMAADLGSAINILVTDVVMPEMNGAALATELLGKFPDLTCLFVSGYSSDTFDSTSSIDPAQNLLRKPFTLKDLAARVRDTLEAPAQSS